jgi:catechol 2,3-dioxygenase-like lactoylglutathione lyase family enzyme
MGLKQIGKGTMRAGGKFVQFIDEESGQQLELNYYPLGTKYHEDYCEGSELDHLAFWCEDVREDYKRILVGGATSAIEPWDEGRYTLAFARDPDGVWIELIGKRVKSSKSKKE